MFRFSRIAHTAQNTALSNQNEQAGIHETRMQFRHQLNCGVLQTGPLLTVPYLLPRHAKAGRSQSDAEGVQRERLQPDLSGQDGGLKMVPGDSVSSGAACCVERLGHRPSRKRRVFYSFNCQDMPGASTQDAHHIQIDSHRTVHGGLRA